MIPDEAVAAAARALYELQVGQAYDDKPEYAAVWEGYATVALEAAAPHLTTNAVAYLDKVVRMISTGPDASEYERGFDDAIRGMAAKTKRLLEGKEQ